MTEGQSIPAVRIGTIEESKVHLTRWIISAIAVVALLVLMSCGGSNGTAEQVYERVIQGNVFDTTPIRGALRPLRLRRSGFEYRCSECHNDFQTRLASDQLQGEHKDIVFDHGLNTQCQNCHHPVNRDAYVDHDGSEIPQEQPARLCAKCHGPQYRDWEKGIHGRKNGYWNVALGSQTRLFCIQCHDPHHPKFPLMKPDPPPMVSRLQTKPGRLHK